MRPLALLLLCAALAACGGAAPTTSAAPATTDAPTTGAAAATGAAPAANAAAVTSGAGSGRCGTAGPETLAQTAGAVAVQIYQRELQSSEVRSDQRQVEGYVPLLSALASGNRAAAHEAVNTLVFSHTHVVRLRVTQGSTVVADIGGPYIIAPVGGSLRFNGHTVGQYVLSVQDDLGYVKLETRFIGAPLVLHVGSTRLPVEGTVAPGPSSVPAHGPVHYQGVSYQAFSFSGKAFPAGTLRISLLLPLPSGLATTSCASIRLNELNLIAQRVLARFKLDRTPISSFVDSIASLTGGLSYVRAGSQQLASSSGGGPRRLPDSGTISYHRKSYAVTSFLASGEAGVRVYLLIPASTLAGA